MARRKRPWMLTRSERACRGKHRYESMRVAQMQADAKGAAVGVPLWAYHCPECKKYHLTSQPQEPRS